MSATSKIEWTEATWNPLVGCTKVSAGCDHCYAETLVNRFAGKNKGFPNRFDVVTIRDDKMLTQPLRWRQPKRIFVNSLSDLFHKDVPNEFIAKVFAVMALAPQHTFQLLTKRHARMRSLLASPAFEDQFDRAINQRLEATSGPRLPGDWNHLTDGPLPNVWLGVSVESAGQLFRVDALRETRAAVRFISAEPLLGPLDGLNLTGIDWVICGGESGPGARPMHLDWARSLRDQCVAAGVPFLFKQWGNWAPQGLHVGQIGPREYVGEVVNDGKHTDLTWRRLYTNVGKKAAGRELDGRTWDEYPVVVS